MRCDRDQGAHANKGLGHKFLKHVERCKALILIVDASQPAPDEGLNTLLRELELYQVRRTNPSKSHTRAPRGYLLHSC